MNGFWSRCTRRALVSSDARPPWLDRLDFGWGSRPPPVLQTEAAECGLACLVMVLGQFGTTTDLPTLRGRYGAMPQGMTLAELVRVAAAEQLSTRAVRVDLDEMDGLRLPCVLHWDLGHFVVLYRISGERFFIIDPAQGERRIGRAELSARFSGVALEIWPTSEFSPRQEGQTISIKRLVGRIKGLWAALWRVFAVSIGLEVLVLVNPLFMQWVVDNVIVSRDIDLLATLGVGFLLLLLAQQLMTLSRSWLVLRVGTQLRVQWRTNVLDHLMRLPLDYFSRRHLGDVMSRFGSIGNIQQVLTSTFVEAALDGLMVLLALSLMLLYSPTLSIVAIVSVLLYALVRSAWYGPLRDATAERLVRSALESSHLLETVRGIRTIRLFARHQERLSTWQSLMVADVNANLRIQKLDILYRVCRRTLSGIFSLVLIWLGATEVIAAKMTVGMLLAFLAYRSQFDTRVTELVNKWFELKMLSLDAHRLADIVLTPTENDESRRLRRMRRAPPAIEISGLSFRYSEGSPNVLDNLNLKVDAGQSLAIAGSSGCGKSTLINLLLGVHRPQQGSILIDGIALEQFGFDSWRAQVGTVLQDDVLFAGSIADNISFFDPRADRDHVEHCASIAAIHDDIMRLPMAYQSLVGDMGTTLSGGQKQRILLARALYRKPRVLILDEATSHLDISREAQVSRAISALPMTRIIVAHRPHTLVSVDRVVEMVDGQIVRDEPAAAFSHRLGLQSFGTAT